MRPQSFNRPRRLQVVARGALALLLTIWTAAAASAQATLTQNQGPNLGTWTEGFIQLSLAASGGGGNGTYVWSLVPGTGSLPPGISLRTDVPSFFSANANAGLIGIATTPGNYSFTLRVTSGGQTVDRAYTWRISGLTPKDNNLPDAFVGRSYSYQFTALGNAGPVTWAPNGALPAGLNLSPTGLLTGIPQTAGFVSVNFSLNDGVDQTFSGRGLSIFAIDITTNGTLPNATQGASYTANITAVGGSGGYTFSACSGNTTACVPGTFIFPSGLSMDANGVISGTVDPNAGTGKYHHGDGDRHQPCVVQQTHVDRRHRDATEPSESQPIRGPLRRLHVGFDLFSRHVGGRRRRRTVCLERDRPARGHVDPIRQRRHQSVSDAR